MLVLILVCVFVEVFIKTVAFNTYFYKSVYTLKSCDLSLDKKQITPTVHPGKAQVQISGVCNLHKIYFCSKRMVALFIECFLCLS